MIEEKKLDVSGIQFLGIAQLISLCGGTLVAMAAFFLALLSGNAAMDTGASTATTGGGSTFLTLVVEIAVFVLFILGLTRLSAYTDSFRKARTYYIINLAIGIAGGFLAVVILLIWVMTTATASSINYGLGMSVGIFFFVLVVDAAIALGAWLKIEILHHTAHGIQEMAVAAEENALIASLRKMDRIYRLFTIICAAVIGVCIAGLGVALYVLLSSYRSMDYMMGGMVAAGVLGLIALVGVVLLASLVMIGVEIYVTVMYFKSAQRLRGKTVTVQTAADSDKMTLLAPLSKEAKENLRAKSRESVKPQNVAEKPAQETVSDVAEKPAQESAPAAEEKPAEAEAPTAEVKTEVPAASNEPEASAESDQAEGAEAPEDTE